MKVKIGNIVVGGGCPPLVVPEVGINHNGDLDTAIRLVDAAKEVGAKCIKFQTHITEKEMIKTDMTPGDISDESLWDIIKRCELSLEEEKGLKAYCDKKEVMFLSSSFSREAADRLENLDVPAHKIGSGESTNLPLIEHIAKKGKPIILSTGMTELEELDESVKLIKKLDAPLILLQCTSLYPTPYKHIKLGAIKILEERYGVPVGSSDHSIGIYTALGAVALGACIVEKHFTLDKDMDGPDQKLSIESEELRELIKGASAIFEASGSEKRILPEERPIINFARESVVAVKDIKKGETFDRNNLRVKRPATGEIPAKDLEKVMGKQAARNIKSDEQIQWSDAQ